MVNFQDLDDIDVIIIEGDGKIDDDAGYGTPIMRRLESHGISSNIVPLKENIEKLNQIPPKPLFISGGMTEVTSDKPWMKRARQWCKGLIEGNKDQPGEKQVPLLGICFGAQLIAEAFEPGSVHYLDTPEIGSSTITLDIADHWLFESISSPFDAFAFHYNQIKNRNVVPISTHKIEQNEFLQAFEIPGVPCFGVQFHPEFRFSEMERLFLYYEDLIKDLGFNSSNIIQDLPRTIDNSIILKNFYSRCKG
ncbi:MAG: type 1 glutamine amidotransferase [Candidatus Hodarchaeota archaeon]